MRMHQVPTLPLVLNTREFAQDKVLVVVAVADLEILNKNQCILCLVKQSLTVEVLCISRDAMTNRFISSPVADN